MAKKKIAIFASGSGTNAEALVRYFENRADVEISLILANKPDAYVLTRAENLGIPSSVFNRTEFREGIVLERLVDQQIDFVVLAGFLWLVPSEMIARFENKIINIHPSLLPKYGGKGMYGARVHEAVIASDDTQSGITIHLVDEIYDNGRILCQEKVQVAPDDTPDSLAQKIHKLEHIYFPQTVEKYIREFG